MLKLEMGYLYSMGIEKEMVQKKLTGYLYLEWKPNGKM
jgi:hypothetical protein